MSAPIAVAEPGRAVTLLRPEGGGWTVAPLAPSGAWPAWRPGHAEVALSVVHGAGDGQRSAIELVDLRGNRRRSLFESPAGAEAAIAPNVPHYALWSPDGARLAFVAQGRAGLTLFVSEAEGPLIADPVQTGGPIFLAWSPDGRRLAVHAGVNLALLELAEARASRPLSAEARGFRTPAFSPDGALLAHATPDAEGEGVIVRVAQAASGESAELHPLPGGVALSFRPGTRTLTAAVTTCPRRGPSTSCGRSTLMLREGSKGRLAGCYVILSSASTGIPRATRSRWWCHPARATGPSPCTRARRTGPSSARARPSCPRPTTAC